VVLDQAEEAFTHPRIAISPGDDAGATGRPASGPDAELEDLLEAVRKTFVGPEPARRPRGKLILGFRNEWLDRFQQAFTAAKLGWEPMPLKPLDQAGIVEAIEGTARDPALRRQYQLTISPGLSSLIANDLLADTGSALAPTLQFLLTKMWTRGGRKEGRTFDQDLYRSLQHEGYQLGDMLHEGLKAVSAEVRESGLALDVLEFHTTEFDTAAQRTRAELEERYPHREEALDGLLRILEEEYLLISTQGRAESSAPSATATRLAHDTLAPVVRKQFVESTAPGQRARRLLESRAREWNDGECSHPLDAADLATVESGASGMRAWSDDETRLVEASRKAEERREASEAEKQARIRKAEDEKRRETQRRLKQQTMFTRGLGLLVCVLLAVSYMALRSGQLAKRSGQLAESRANDLNRQKLKQRANYLLGLCKSAKAAQKPQLRLILAVETLRFIEQHRADRSWASEMQEADQAFKDAFDSIQGQALFRQTEATTALAYLPDHTVVTGSRSGKLRAWSLKNLKSPPRDEIEAHDGQEICKLIASPDHRRLVSAGLDGKLKVWRVDREGGIGRDPIEAPAWLDHEKGKPISLLFADRDTVLSSSKGKIYFWDLRDPRQAKSLSLPDPLKGSDPQEITALALPPNVELQEILSSIGRSKTAMGRIARWIKDAEGNWRQRNYPDPFDRPVLAMSILGKTLIVADEAGSIREHCLDGPFKMSHSNGHQGPIRGLIPVPDREGCFITCGDDGTVRLWKTGTPSEWKILRGHEDKITAGVFDLQGRLLTGSLDGSVRLWDLNKAKGRPDEPGSVELASKVAGRNLTKDEWQISFPGEPYCRTFQDIEDSHNGLPGAPL
jgi:WD40 repeat protein